MCESRQQQTNTTDSFLGGCTYTARRQCLGRVLNWAIIAAARESGSSSMVNGKHGGIEEGHESGEMVMLHKDKEKKNEWSPPTDEE